MLKSTRWFAPSALTQVTLNWENVDYAWVEQQEVRSMDTVPLMPET